MKRLFLLAFLLFSSCQSTEDLTVKPKYGTFGKIQEKSINESSGLIASRQHKGLFWTHNDSGDKPRIFAITEKGELLGEYEIEGAQAFDWEDIGIDQNNNLYIADVGNNALKRKNLKIYKVAEPKKIKKKGLLKVIEVIEVDYPEGKFNCEAFAIEPQGSLILITKDPRPAHVYRYENKKWVKKQSLKNINSYVTGADINAKGDLALSTYKGFHIYKMSPEGLYTKSQYVLSMMKQCEAVSWIGEKLIFTNEQRDIYKLDPKRFKARDTYLPSKKKKEKDQE
jgi:hypothetical protein